MANKKSKKKSNQASPAASKAQPAQAAGKKADAKKAAPQKEEKKSLFKKGEKAPETSKKASKKTTKAKNAKPGVIARAKKYLGSIRSEMKRVVWPSKKELINYSVAVVVSLVVVGIVIAVLDVVIGEGLLLLSGLRG